MQNRPTDDTSPWGTYADDIGDWDQPTVECPEHGTRTWDELAEGIQAIYPEEDVEQWSDERKLEEMTAFIEQ